MSKLNWSRVIGCGLVAGIVWIILGSVVSALLGRDFAALPNNRLAHPTPGFILLNVVLDLLEGISMVWLYAVLRPVYGIGARTAIIAGFAWWFIVSLEDATWCSFGIFPPRTIIPLMIGTLPALVLAALAGAKCYRYRMLDRCLPSVGYTAASCSCSSLGSVRYIGCKQGHTIGRD